RGARVRAVGHLHATSPPFTNAPRASRRQMSVDAAYAEVQRVTRKRARNFAYGIMVLPREKRRAIAAIYAFARRVDDIADGELPEADRRAALVELQVALQQTVTKDDAMLVALADARRRFPIPDTAPCARLPAGRTRIAALAGFAQRALRVHVRRAVPRDSRTDRGIRFRRVRRPAAPLGTDQAADRRRGLATVRACVVGGGLAGCAAALELVRGGHDVALLEARPTLGGAVQTLPEREGDPSPPPDNGQHIALGCFTEYLRFLAEIG